MLNNSFVHVIDSLISEPQASLLNGILFGIRAQIPRDFYLALIQTGTIHIIALSGMNISILISLVAKATLFIGRKSSSIITLCLIVIFVLFVGPKPPVVRAAIMGSFSLFAIYFGRQYWGMLSLFLASLIMIFYSFSLIKDLSFQLSFLATLGILLAHKRVECQKRKGLINQLIYSLVENIKLTLSAQLFTLPIILYNFHRISLIAPIANLLVQWAIQPIMILGFLASIMGSIWLPAGIIPGWMVWVPLTYIIMIVQALAKIPYASIEL